MSLQEVADHLSLSIQDNGVGLDGGRSRGTGMGQELVRALAQQLGGELQVASNERGSKFRVVFPRGGADAAAACGRPAAALH